MVWSFSFIDDTSWPEKSTSQKTLKSWNRNKKKEKKKKLRRHVLDFFLCKSRNKKACIFGDSYQKPVYIEWKQRKINQLFPNEIASSVILNFVNDTRRLHSWKGVETCDPQGQSLSNGSLVQQRNLWLLLESLSSYFEEEAPERRGSLRPIYFTSIWLQEHVCGKNNSVLTSGSKCETKEESSSCQAPTWIAAGLPKALPQETQVLILRAMQVPRTEKFVPLFILQDNELNSGDLIPNFSIVQLLPLLLFS